MARAVPDRIVRSPGVPGKELGVISASTYIPEIEIEAPDISRWRAGNTGIDYVSTFDSGVPGPHAMVNALTHGNELSGVHALRFLFENEIRPRRGRLTLSMANVAAYRRFDAAAPFDSRFVDEDFNRVWDADVLDGPRRSTELDRARMLRPLVDTADMLLDLHSTALPMAPMLLCGVRDKGLALARAVAFPAHVVIDAGHAAGRRLRDYGQFDTPETPQASLLVECGQHFEKAAADVAIETALRFLRHCGTIDEDVAARHLHREPAAQMAIRVTDVVTIATADFAFERDLAGFEVIPEGGTLIARDGADEVRTPYDNCVMVMPARDLKPGLTAVRLGQIVD